MLGPCFFLGALLSIVGGAATAQTASLTITHDDLDGIVDPGQVVGITVTMRWTERLGATFIAFELLQGDVDATPGVGIASNSRFGHANPWVGQNTRINPGMPAGGGVAGVDIMSGWVDPFGLNNIHFYPPWGYSDGLVVLEFDWKAPLDAGEVTFAWSDRTQFPGGLPGPTFVAGSSFFVLPTTFNSATLTVISAPAGLAAIALIATASCRRR